MELRHRHRAIVNGAKVSTERLHPSLRAVWGLTEQIPIARQNFLPFFLHKQQMFINFAEAKQ